MNLEAIILNSTDNLELPGILYSPEKTSKKAVIYLHGNGDSGVFYNIRKSNALGSELASQGIAFLAFNNRGARYKKKLTITGSGEPGHEEHVMGGAHYELIEDCVKDINGAIEFLESKGFEEFYLLGFSTGANKICVYDQLVKRNKIAKYIHAGPGDDSGLFYNEIGEKRFKLSLQYAARMLRLGKPFKIMPKYSGMHPFSAQSAYDILDPDGPYNTFPYFEATTKRLGKKTLFKEYKNITKPQLVVFGEFDEYTYTGGGTKKTLDLIKSYTNQQSNAAFDIIPDTDHSFNGKELELAKLVADWLTES